MKHTPKPSLTSWAIPVQLSPPSLNNNTADADRLIAHLCALIGTRSVHVDLALVKHLPRRLRESDYNIQCILFKHAETWLLSGITPMDSSHRAIGLAVDLGTTRVVMRLIDLASHDVLTESAFDNPQIAIGPDILSRIHYSTDPAGLDHLQRLIIDGFNENINDLCSACAITPEDIYLATVAGNTAMTHLFLGVDPRYIIREPYIPAINKPETVKANSLGLQINPWGHVYVFPNIGSYFGGDLISGILYSGMNKHDGTSILVDVGTNAEVVLGNRNWLIACAGAAGPALEGGVTKMGMMAGPGVIDKVTIDPATYEFDIHTIGEQPAIGICGSGLIDLVSYLFLAGFVDVRGKFVPDICGSKLIEEEGIPCLVIVPAATSGNGRDIVLSQVDLDLFVSSKAAMYTILNTITNTVGTAFNELERFYVAGTFGSFINPRSAIDIGMIPDLPLDTYQVLGNSSLGGAALLLTSPGKMDEINQIRDSITYLELNVNQDFMIKFSGAKFFPNTDASLFPSVKTWRTR